MFDRNTNNATSTILTYCNDIQCGACAGSGFQRRDDGIFIECPVCRGTGRRQQRFSNPVSEPQRYYPWQSISEIPEQVKYIITC